MSGNVALVLGAGPRVGASVAQKFSSNGYKVAIASRSGTGSKTTEGFLSLRADFTKPDSVPALFDAVKNEFKKAPSVFVYNAAALTNPPDKDSIFSIPSGSVVSQCQHYYFHAYERQGDGKSKGLALDGAAHGEFFAQLANHEGNVPWHATFVKDKGYVQFKQQDRAGMKTWGIFIVRS
ncbi:hypothetical protein F4813DRAFT_390755 [Daldinia decipiens]|uniref:uncharacterized protein n=1 Tax=Daldinia decipiens TaxID=326647 RepID=UPI0020C4F7AF|nr:uncharacterized protein F4813DRAFT_390755 [Daldinia decipiens]KAI1656386.1 hypothetical protein F4813DRAFT_390755 [Daldinia decipiens]